MSRASVAQSGAGLPGPSSLLTAYAGSVVSPPSSHARKLLTRLDKSEVISLALGWLRSSSSAHLPPVLSRRPPRSEPASTSANAGARANEWAALDLSEERKARTLADAITIWDGPMRDARVPKVRAVDRVLEVDWSDGLSFAMLAEIELAYLKARRTSRTWIAAKLEYASDRAQHPTVSGALLRDLYAQELRHYFAHYLHLSQPSSAPAASDAGASAAAAVDDWTSAFTCLRLTLAPTSAELCASGFYVLHIPRTPWLLVSGSPGRGLENRTIALAAFAQAAGARSVTLSAPPAQLGAGGSDDSAVSVSSPGRGKSKALAELKGRDPLSLRDILARDALPDGGHGLDMAANYVEDGPLVDALHRRREAEAVAVYGRLLSPPPAAGADDGAPAAAAAANGLGQHAPAQHAGAKRLADKAREERSFKRRREAKEMFGAREADALPVVPRIDFELHLPFPQLEPYTQPSMDLLDAEPIRLRLEGAHVQAGLRKLVLAGLDDRAPESASADRSRARNRLFPAGLPSWMAQVKGTNVVIGLRSGGREGDAASDVAGDGGGDSEDPAVPAAAAGGSSQSGAKEAAAGSAARESVARSDRVEESEEEADEQNVAG